MWLKLLHTIGLTNLSDEQVNRYDSERLGQVPHATSGVESVSNPISLAEMLRVTLAMAVLAVALAANWARLMEPHPAQLLGMIAGLMLVAVPWMILTTASREEARFLREQFGRRQERLDQAIQRLMKEVETQEKKLEEQADRERELERQFEAIRQKAS